uniref:hypothetical protein n=1 Tax=Rothia nasimurium TaxID=85336 RepID=UPI001F22CD13
MYQDSMLTGAIDSLGGVSNAIILIVIVCIGLIFLRWNGGRTGFIKNMIDNRLKLDQIQNPSEETRAMVKSLDQLISVQVKYEIGKYVDREQYYRFVQQ